MQLAVKSRTEPNAKKVRREGQIPAILYSRGAVGEQILVDANDWKKLINLVPKGTLSSKIFELDLHGKKRKAIVKDVHYHVTTYAVLHLDFEELHEDVEVQLRIPVQLMNTVDCAGVKLGGVIRQVVAQLKVRALPRFIPDCFKIDVKEMQLGQSKRLSEIEIPPGVKPVDDMNNVAVVIARR